MKIVCGACGAKYAVADEKVSGRSVKIRCKKCGDAILVRGDAQPVAEAAAWHVVVNGEQSGPTTPVAIGALIAAGTIGWDAYVWREGFAEWKPAEDVKDLVAEIMGEPARAAGADLFATESQSAFAGGHADGDDVIASSSAPRADAMTGQRNESSVLFSLANLSALGASGTASASAPVTAARPHAMASGDGSGLIDIRALASATGLGAPAAAPRVPAKVDDLLGLGAPSLSLGSALAPPVLISAKPETARSGNALIFAAAILAVGLLGGATALAYVGVGHADRPAPVAQTPVPIAPPPAVLPPPDAPVVVAVVAPPAPVEETPVGTHVRPVRRPVPVVERPDTTPPVPTHPPTDHDRTLEEMMEHVAHEPTPHAQHVETTPAPTLHAAPERAEIMSAMTRVRDTVAACGAGEHGMATVDVTFASTGHVSNAVVTGAFAGTPVGSCVARSVRTASVAPFSRSTFSLSYPFRI